MKPFRPGVILLVSIIVALAFTISVQAAPSVLYGLQVGGNTSAPPALSFVATNKVKLAVNFGGTNLVRNGISFTSVLANGTGSTSNLIGGYTIRMSTPTGGLNNGTFGDALFGTFIWAQNQSPQTLTLEGFDSTKTYKVYYLVGDSRVMTFNMRLALTAAHSGNSASITNYSFTWGGAAGLSNYVYLPVVISGASSLSAVMSQNGGSAGVAFSGVLVEEVPAAGTPTVIVSTFTAGNPWNGYTVSETFKRGAQFTTDDNYYTLSSVSVLFTIATLNDPIRIALHSDSGGVPGDELVRFTGETTPGGGTFVYVPESSLVLSPTTTYHLVASVPAPGTGSYNWGAVNWGGIPGSLAGSGPGTTEIAGERSISGAAWENFSSGHDVFVYSVSGMAQPSLRAIGLNGGAFQGKVGGFRTHYYIQASTNLTTWTTILTNVAQQAPYTFRDPSSPALPKRFYRMAE